MNEVKKSPTKVELMKCTEAYILGTLAVNEAFYPGGETNEPVTYIKNGVDPIFYLKPLSEEPLPVSEYFKYRQSGNLYVGFGDRQPSGVIDNPRYSELPIHQKLDFWHEKLKDRLVLFHPRIKFAPNEQPYLNIDIVAIEDKLPQTEGDYLPHYLCMPKIQMDNATFEQKLLTGSYITFKEYQHFFKDPAYVICGNYLYFNFQSWTRHPENTMMWKTDRGADLIMRVPLDFNGGEFAGYVVSGTQYLEFINEDYEMVLNDTLNNLGESIVANQPMGAVAPKTRHEAVSTTPISKGSVSITPPMTTPLPTLESEEEVQFLQELQIGTLKEGLSYNLTDLINFHVSVKTNPLTVVAGMSGTGKTQLARAYAKVLGLAEADGNLLFLPINPSYMEPSDILGYLNTQTGLYMPAETGLVDLLFQAEQNPDRFYMVIFDEMNLSQVEHWFAPFLSLLELPAKERRLKLYSKENTWHAKSIYKDTVQIGDNVIFVGTVNLDETTKEFSDRLLDRVNVVTLQKGSFTQLQQVVPADHPDRTFDYEQYRSWSNQTPGVQAYTQEELAFFDELHEIINRYDSQKGVSYRLIDKMGAYILNLPQTQNKAYTLSKEVALDLGIKQRLLTKIKGSDRQIGYLVGTTLKPDIEPLNSELLELFKGETAQRISTFEMTQKELKRKALELGVHGYTN